MIFLPNHALLLRVQSERAPIEVPKHEQIVSTKKQVNPTSVGALPIDSTEFKSVLPYIKQAEKRAKEEFGYDLPKGLLPAIYMQESSAGKNKSNYNPSLGEKAYMLGMAKEGIDRLKEIKFNSDLNTEQGVFDSAARLLADKSIKYDYDQATNTRTVNKEASDKYAQDPALLYTQRYYGGKEPQVYNKVKGLIDYYSNVDY